MSEHGSEVAVDWANGLVLHEHDVEWHPWDVAVFGPRPEPADIEEAAKK